MNEFNKWIGHRVKIYVKGLSDGAIIYTANIISIDDDFITFYDKKNVKVSVNIKDIIQIKGEEE